MNETLLTNAWAWGILQGSLVAMIALAILQFNRSLTPHVRVQVALIAMLWMIVMPLMMLVPTKIGTPLSRSVDDSLENRLPTRANPESERLVNDLDPVALTPAEQFSESFFQLTANITETFAGLSQNVDGAIQAMPAADNVQGRLPWFPVVIVTFVLLGCIRLLSGWWQVRKITLEAKPCSDPHLLHRILGISQELNIRFPSEWLEHPNIPSPAVLGLKRPSIVLPVSWKDWSEAELVAAIAHELAHLRRRDPFINVVAQISLAFNFFNPLAHLLLRQVRLNQELAADSLAAPVVGGQQKYLQNLASLALRRTNVRMSWSALTFLPSRSTFVRRLEMFRNLCLEPTRWSRMGSAITFATFLFASAAVTFWRPAIAQQTLATEPVLRASSNDAVPALSIYSAAIPAQALIRLEIEKILELKEIGDLIKSSEPYTNEEGFRGTGIKLGDIESVIIIVETEKPPMGIARLKPGSRWESPLNLPLGQIHQLDSRTLLLCDQDQSAVASSMIVAGRIGKGSKLSELLDNEKSGLISVAWHSQAIGAKMPPEAAIFAPLWEDVDTGTLTASVSGEDLELSSTLHTSSPDSVASTLEALKILAKNFTERFRGQTRNRSGGYSVSGPFDLWMANIQNVVRPSLDVLAIQRKDGQVVVSTKVEHVAAIATGFLAPAIKSASENATRAQQANALRQIGLALHNYHDAHGHFPPSVLEENGVKRSWRVEILPYIEQAALYEAYRKDLPWDSPENMKIAEMIVPVFSADRRKPQTRIRAIGGEHGLLGSKEGKGISMTDARDGLSKTIAAVEFGAPIAWTQPEEFVFAPEDIQSVEGPGMNALFGDGSIKYLSKTIDRKILEAMLTRDGLETLTMP